MKNVFLLLFVSLVGAQIARSAEQSTNPEAPAAPVPTVAFVDEKNKSTFTMDPNDRNPFWPIGWKPAAKAGPEVAGPTIPPSAFSVTSITLGNNERFAIINGKVMQEGQQFGLQMGNQTYQVTVKAIEDGQVVLLRRDEEIVVPLRRK